MQELGTRDSDNKEPPDLLADEAGNRKTSETAPRRLQRYSTITDRIDEFFTQDDDLDNTANEHDYVPTISADVDDDTTAVSAGTQAMTPQMTPQTVYKYQFHYNVSYWITVKSIMADFLFTISSGAWFAWETLSDTDYYVLVTITGFVGMVLYVVGGYIALFQIMNDRPQKSKRWLCCYREKKSLAFWGSLIFLSGSCITLIKNWFYLLAWDLPVIADAVMSLFSGLCYFIGGLFFMYPNKCWIWRPYKLAWWASWLWGVGGFCFLLFGIGAFFPDNPTVVLWLGMIPSILGMLCYLFADVFTVTMWKLEQYGNIFLPELNENKWKKKKNVLYRDIMFLALYILSATVFLIGLSYASLCIYFKDWIKGYILGLTASFAILLMGSFLHKEPEKPPFSYLLWYLRFYFIWMTINAIIDTYHISGTQCHLYGCSDIP